jgi:muramidase (phage lysozyme)
MTDTTVLVSESGTPLIKAAEKTTTPAGDSSAKVVKVDKKAIRKAQNEAYLSNPNVKAFLDTIADCEGGDYDFMYGAVKGKKNDKWRIKDYSTHPGAGAGGKTTAAGRYQINKANWTENGIKKMGLTDFSPHTQDLIAVEGLRQAKAIEAVVEGDMTVAISKAAKTWNSMPLGKGAGNRVAGQHYFKYEEVVSMFKSHGGMVSKE